jgi:hypothetical protein
MNRLYLARLTATLFKGPIFLIINLFMYNQHVFYFAKIQKNNDIITLMMEKQLKVDRTKGQS